MGYPPTAIGYLPTAVGYPPTVLQCRPLVCRNTELAAGRPAFFQFSLPTVAACLPWPLSSAFPQDLVAAGLVTVTNSFGTKTVQLLEAVSKNFVVAQPFLKSVVKALVRAAEKAGDVTQRLENAAHMNWESNWLGDRCFGPPLMELVKGWFEVHDPLWPYEKAFE